MSSKLQYNKKLFADFVESQALHNSANDENMRAFFINEGLNPDEEFRKIKERAKMIMDNTEKKQKKNPKPRLG